MWHVACASVGSRWGASRTAALIAALTALGRASCSAATTAAATLASTAAGTVAPTALRTASATLASAAAAASAATSTASAAAASAAALSASAATLRRDHLEGATAAGTGDAERTAVAGLDGSPPMSACDLPTSSCVSSMLRRSSTSSLRSKQRVVCNLVCTIAVVV